MIWYVHIYQLLCCHWLIGWPLVDIMMKTISRYNIEWIATRTHLLLARAILTKYIYNCDCSWIQFSIIFRCIVLIMAQSNDAFKTGIAHGDMDQNKYVRQWACNEYSMTSFSAADTWLVVPFCFIWAQMEEKIYYSYVDHLLLHRWPQTTGYGFLHRSM